MASAYIESAGRRRCFSRTETVARRFIGVVPPASKREIVHSARPTERERDDVVELEEARFAASTIGAGECAPACITLPYGATDGGWNTARARSTPSRLRVSRADLWTGGACPE